MGGNFRKFQSLPRGRSGSKFFGFQVPVPSVTVCFVLTS